MKNGKDVIAEGRDKRPELASRVEKRPELPAHDKPHVDPIDKYQQSVEMEEEIRHGVMVDAPISERAELLAALTEAHEAIQGARKYGEVGTQDCDITDHNTRMDRALLAISSVLNKLAAHVYGVPGTHKDVTEGGQK